MKFEVAVNDVPSKFSQIVPEFTAYMVGVFHDFSMFHFFHGLRIEEGYAYG